MKEIKNTTIYNEENVKKFLNTYFFEKIKTIRIILNILIIVIVISYILNENRTTLDLITLIFSLFGLIEINTSLIPNINYIKLKKQKNSIINTKVNYVFKENNFKLNKNEYIDYKDLKKVIETENTYYLYIDNSRSLIVDKSSFTNDQITTITNILKKHVTTYKHKK